THSAASLTPFLKETWRDEEADLDQCLLNHWQLFNGLMIQKYRITDEYALSPRSVKELVYDVQYDWRKQCALSQPSENLSTDEDSSATAD
ncbi:MAG: TetR/AcrR family transcriptional regulator, partial [Vibrio metschnikovii]|nr:TetR/AcrR family transcriptional regulator [Vibrio metschnikovii]